MAEILSKSSDHFNVKFYPYTKFFPPPPSEPSTSGSWRSIQSYDTANMRRVRELVKNLEKKGRVAREIGGHAIIMLGQIQEYIMLMGERWLPPEPIEDRKILGAYAFPAEWHPHVEKAARIFGVKVIQRIANSRVQVWILGRKEGSVHKSV